jgi:hypothetical protein
MAVQKVRAQVRVVALDLAVGIVAVVAVHQACAVHPPQHALVMAVARGDAGTYEAEAHDVAGV